MAAPKKKFDMEAVSKAAVAVLNAQTQSGGKVTATSLIQDMVSDGSTIAATRLAVLIKELSDSNRLEGFYLCRGRGFVHENDVPRSAKVTKAKSKKSKKSKKQAAATLTPNAIAAEIDRQEAEAAENEYRELARQRARAALGLTG